MRRLDDRELRELQKANGPALLLYFERRIEHPEDAAALFNDLLLIIWQRSSDVPRDPVEARMWMFGVARRQLFNHSRSARRRHALTEELRSEIANNAVLASDDAIAVRRAVSSLPVTQRELVRLVHWDGFSLEEAARIMGIRSSTARSRYQVAKRALAKELTPEPDLTRA